MLLIIVLLSAFPNRHWECTQKAKACMIMNHNSGPYIGMPKVWEQPTK